MNEETLPEPGWKEAWWSGFKAALNLPDGVTRAEALRIKALMVGERSLMADEARNMAGAAIGKAMKP